MSINDEVQQVFASADCLHTQQQVEAALDRIADGLNARLHNTNPVLLCVVVGGIVTLGNLLPRLTFPLQVDYVHVTRYQGKTDGGSLQWIAKNRLDLRGRTVVVVDDILDAGHTMQAVIDLCRAEGASAIYSVVLVAREKTRQPDGSDGADFVGVYVDDRYVFGYGLDYKEYLRNAPGIYAVV